MDLSYCIAVSVVFCLVLTTKILKGLDSLTWSKSKPRLKRVSTKFLPCTLKFSIGLGISENFFFSEHILCMTPHLDIKNQMYGGMLMPSLSM